MKCTPAPALLPAGAFGGTNLSAPQKTDPPSWTPEFFDPALSADAQSAGIARRSPDPCGGSERGFPFSRTGLSIFESPRSLYPRSGGILRRDKPGKASPETSASHSCDSRPGRFPAPVSPPPPTDERRSDFQRSQPHPAWNRDPSKRCPHPGWTAQSPLKMLILMS